MNVTGVILAAGRGVRMLPFTHHYPKPILPVCNKPLLCYQIEAMKSVGITDIIIVIGHLGYQIVKAIGDGSHYGVNIRYIEQEQTLGIAHAVYKLELEVNTPFLLFLGDIFFKTKDLNEMIRCLEEDKVSGVLATKTEEDPAAISRNFSIILDKDGYVKRLIEKPKHFYGNLKGCGIYLFNLDVFDALRRTPRTAMRDEYEITDAIQILIDDGHRVAYKNIIEEDINLTYPSDLLMCNFKMLEWTGKAELVGNNCDFHSDIAIKKSVIGNNVAIKHKTTISNSLIFDEVEVSSKLGKIDNTIITPFQSITC